VASDVVVQAYLPRGNRVIKSKRIDRLRFAFWNIGTLMGKSIELVKAPRKRIVDIACILETKWVGAKA